MSKFENGQAVEYKVHRHMGGGRVDQVWIPAIFVCYDYLFPVIEFADHIVREYNLGGSSLVVHNSGDIR